MTSNPKIAIGLRCLACALAAKSLQITRRKRLGLLALVLAIGREDDQLVAAVLNFEARVEHDPRSAGAELHDWLISAAAPDGLPESAEDVTAALAAIEAAPEYEWQRRADING